MMHVRRIFSFLCMPNFNFNINFNINFNAAGQAGNHPGVRGCYVEQSQQQGGRHLGRGERDGSYLLLGIDVVGA